MFSCTMIMSKSWQPHTDFMEFEPQWQWPEMDPWKMIIDDDPVGSGAARVKGKRLKGSEYKIDSSESSITGHEVKTWDINDPSLNLKPFFSSEEWKNQTLVPDSDFINLLYTLRPIDHAFFITLFINQLPQKMKEVWEETQRNTPKSTSTRIKEQASCGSWVQNYVEFQNRILDKTLPSRYSIHTCPMVPKTRYYGAPESIDTDQQEQQPCGDMFSQMLAMTSAFAWSVTESRGFFSNQDQIRGLQESFDQSLLQHWITPPKAESTAKIDTEDMAIRDLNKVFQLDDPLFNNDSENGGNDRLYDSIAGDSEDEPLTDKETQSRLRSLRSKSRNRISFERRLTSNVPNQPEEVRARGGQRRLGNRISSVKMRKLISGLEQDGVELVLNQDLLPQLVNTTRSLRLFLNLGLPLPDNILKHNQQLLKQNGVTINITETTRGPLSAVRRGAPTVHAPYAHGSLFGSATATSSLSSIPANPVSISAALHAAAHDERDLSRTRAVPKTFGCLLDILIQPKIELKQLIHPYATLFKLPAIFSVGIYIRPAPRASSDFASLPSWKTISDNQMKIAKRYLTCARQIAREFAPKRKGQKVIFVVISEDAGMARIMESEEEWDEEVITPKWRISKDHQQKPGQGTLISRQQQAVLENQILSRTDFQVVSDYSDFAKVAVWRTRREGRCIVIRENMTIENEMEAEKDYVDMLDCGVLLKNFIVKD
ncbi:hypothetical protein BGZ49_002654 [Haplosporangium sp. Z 27]|nr:hypothetical protein BGZ49_002654 [Haplosporangium sp. Z 27]